jgi:hypothetical protein
LQGDRFATTDVRLQLSPVRHLSLAVGGGTAWHEGTDLPYVVGAAGMQLPAIGPLRLGVAMEAYYLRVSTDRVRITYQNYVPVMVKPLGRTHQWSPAFTVAVTGAVVLF